MNPEYYLQKFFGYSEFRKGQKEIIDSILNRKNVLAILPTGGGKSLCFQIPALMSKSFSIVVSPLIALMKDQVDSLNKNERIAAFVNSTMEVNDIKKVFNQLANQKLKLLYVSPEKLDSHTFRHTIKNLNPEFIFIDEAHCISEWGHSFRPSYRKINSFIEYVGFKNVSAFTATATKDVREDIINQLRMNEVQVFVMGFERDNLNLNVILCENKNDIFLKIIKNGELPAIVYSATRKKAEEISEYLRSSGIDSVYYHAGLPGELRRLIQDDFQKERVKIIVATNAFGMGIDKNNVRTLIHYNTPASIENYYQEIGRAGRDGLDSNVYLLYDDYDRQIQEYFIKNSFPAREQIEIVYNAICDYSNIAVGSMFQKDIPIDTNIISFLEKKEISKGIIYSSLNILASSNYLVNTEHLKKSYVRILIQPQKLNKYLNQINDNELKDLLLIFIRDYGNNIFRSNVSVNLNSLSHLLNEGLDNITDSLKRLHQSGIIEFQPASIFPTVKILGQRIKTGDLKLTFDKVQAITDHNKQKLDKMIEYIFTSECRFKNILDYFGNSLHNYKCGKCDVCKGTTNYAVQFDSFIEEQIVQLFEDNRQPLNKNLLVNILNGNTNNPAYSNLSGFGSCIHYSKKEINSTINSLVNQKKLVNENGKLFLNKANHNSVEFENTPSRDYESQLKLYNLLRQVRKEISLKFNQSPQLICSDEILLEISRRRPISFSDLMEIKGFNQRMFNKIGYEIINVIQESKSADNFAKLISQKNIPKNIIQILELVKKKYSMHELIDCTNLTESLVAVQIESLLSFMPELEIDYLFKKDELDLVQKLIRKGVRDIKELFDACDKKITYGLLKIALAKYRAIE